MYLLHITPILLQGQKDPFSKLLLMYLPTDSPSFLFSTTKQVVGLTVMMVVAVVNLFPIRMDQGQECVKQAFT